MVFLLDVAVQRLEAGNDLFTRYAYLIHSRQAEGAEARKDQA